jgi:surface carbohydrate biosynthesis protein
MEKQIMIRKFLKYNINCKFQLQNQKNIIIFDKEGSEDIKKYVIGNIEKCFIYDVKTITLYFNINFIIKYIKNLFTTKIENISLLKKLYLIYIKTEIQIFNPKIIITYNDDNIIYHYLIKLFQKITFIAIQNGLREEFIRDRVKHSINHDCLYCFGRNDQKKNILSNWAVKNIHPIGSLRVGIALSKFKSLNKKYDLCFISEYESRKENSESKDYWNNYWLNVSEIVSQLIKKKNYRTIIALNGRGAREINFFKSLFPANVEYSDPKKEHDSYRAILESNLTLGFCSTLLVESMALNTRVLQINTSNTNKYFNFNEIFVHKYSNFDGLVNNIEELISTPYKDYFQKIENFLPEYMNINNANLPQNLIQNNIREILTSTQVL